MNNENSRVVLEEIDGLLKAIGFKDDEHFRLVIEVVSTVCENAAPKLKQFAAVTREDLSANLDRADPAELENGLRQMRELKKFLPTLGVMLIDVIGKVLPPQRGGAPQKLKSPEDKRDACNRIVALIMKGQSEADAKRAVAKALQVSQQTMSRTWKQRASIMQPSPEEFLAGLFRSLATPAPGALNGGHVQDTNENQATK